MDENYFSSIIASFRQQCKEANQNLKLFANIVISICFPLILTPQMQVIAGNF